MKNVKLETLCKRAFGVPDDFTLDRKDLLEVKDRLKHIKPYFIGFTARSGSTFLSHEISRHGGMSYPQEWFNWDYIEKKGKSGPAGIKSYLVETIVEQSSPNDIFGCEINWLQLNAMSSILPIQSIFSTKPVWFFLRRRNLVAQAISNYIANETKVFHSYELNADSSDGFKKVQYKSNEITKLVNDFISQENAFSSWFEKRGASPIDLFYEDLVKNPLGMINLFANVLRVEVKADDGNVLNSNPIKKISTDKNNELESAFRSQEALFLQQAYNRRGEILAPMLNL